MRLRGHSDSLAPRLTHTHTHTHTLSSHSQVTRRAAAQASAVPVGESLVCAARNERRRRKRAQRRTADNSQLPGTSCSSCHVTSTCPRSRCLAIASTEICTHTPLFASSRRICMPTAMPAAFPIALAHALLRCRLWRSAAPAGHMPGTNDRSGRGAQKQAEYLDWITTLISLTASEKTSPVAG